MQKKKKSYVNRVQKSPKTLKKMNHVKKKKHMYMTIYGLCVNS